MNISVEIVLAAITGLGGVLTGAVAKMWLWMTTELKECKDDRARLSDRIEGMHKDINDLSKNLGNLQGKLDNK